MDDEEQEEYNVPLQDQRVWGAGIKRKKITFVPAGSTSTIDPTPQSNSDSAASKYLAIVLKSQPAKSTIPEAVTPQEKQDSLTTRVLDKHNPTDTADASSICSICKAPLQERPNIGSEEVSKSQGEELISTQQKLSRHESSIAHQLCLAHVHPPSALDRSRQGARYLSAYGWDPDARLGLGAQGEGILAPVKGRVKNDTMGIGLEPKSASRSNVDAQSQRPHARGQGKDFKMDAGQVRKRSAEDKKKAERLRAMIYGDDKLRQYLGHDS